MFHFEGMVKATQQTLQKQERFRITIFCSGIYANSLSLQDIIPSWIHNGVPTEKGLWGSPEVLLGKTPKKLPRPIDPIHYSKSTFRTRLLITVLFCFPQYLLNLKSWATYLSSADFPCLPNWLIILHSW